MAIKHKVTINVTDEKGNNVKILRGGQLDPGQSVQSVDVKEIKEGGSTDGQDE